MVAWALPRTGVPGITELLRVRAAWEGPGAPFSPGRETPVTRDGGSSRVGRLLWWIGCAAT